jgi:hypothetical protein
LCNLTSIFFKVRLKLKITLIDNLKIWKLFCNIFKAPPLTISNILPNSWWQTTQHDDKNFFSSVNYSLASNQSNQLSSWQHKKNLYITLNKKKKHHGMLSSWRCLYWRSLYLRDIWGLWWTWFFVVREISGDFDEHGSLWFVLWVEIFLKLWWIIDGSFMYCEWECCCPFHQPRQCVQLCGAKPAYFGFASSNFNCAGSHTRALLKKMI